MAFPDMEDALMDAFEVVTPRTGMPSPKGEVLPPEIQVLRVPGGPTGTPWQDIVQIQITHFGSSREEARALARGTEALLLALNPQGGRIGGAFVDYARKTADGVIVADTNEDVRPIVSVWRFAVRPL